MSAGKKTRADLVGALRQLQSLIGSIQGAYLNDRVADRALKVNTLCTEAFNVAVDALSTDPPEPTRRAALNSLKAPS